MGNQGRENMWKGSGWRTRRARWQLVYWARQWLARREVPYFHVDKQGGKTGEQDRPRNPGFQCGEIKPQNF